MTAINIPLDERLSEACIELLQIGAHDDAVRAAFISLEERLREILGTTGGTGNQLIDWAFNPQKGTLAKQLGESKSEREGLRELFSGAFKTYRNPAAHSKVDYSKIETEAIIGMVNLLHGVLQKSEELPSPTLFTENIVDMLDEIEEVLSVGSSLRIRNFLGRCLEAGLIPDPNGKKQIPFKAKALYLHPTWTKPETHSVAVFYLQQERNMEDYSIRFPTDIYLSKILDFDVQSLIIDLDELGFKRIGKRQEPTSYLSGQNDEEFFANLYKIVIKTIGDLSTSSLGK